MKFRRNQPGGIAIESLPVRGAWIEMDGTSSSTVTPETSLPVRGAWIEIGRKWTA